MAYTANVKLLLEHVLERYSVQSWVDAPCGDCNWQPTIQGFDKVQYHGMDIAPGVIAHNQQKFAKQRNMHFERLDFVANALSVSPDLILCRDAIQHNSLSDGVKAYANFEKSEARWLVTTWHQSGDANRNIESGDYFPVNLFRHPFNFSKPLLYIREGQNGETSAKKVVGLFQLPALGEGLGQDLDISESAWLAASKRIVHIDA